MSTIHVYEHGRHRAMISKQSKGADNYAPAEPWLLLHNTGRTDRFETQSQARSEARKSYAGSTFSRN